ncbi:MAG: N-acetyl sugar amidotransferase [candidate division Zixibacteria bacterium]
MDSNMQVCARCIYDERIPNIKFDNEGICNYCRESEELEKEFPTGDKGWEILKKIAEEIKRKGRDKKYDVVVGVSGGCDSSYLLYLAKEKLGLRPLAVHFDNTWDSKIAVENIYRVTKKLNIDLYTHFVDNKEYNDIYKSFFKASVPEIDTPADIGLITTLYMAAAKFGIKYIMDGHSFRSEGISPQGWFYMDARYIERIQKKFGHRKIKTLPLLKLWRWMKWAMVNRIKRIRPLWYLDYNKKEVKEFLINEYDWQWYGGHHMENRSAYFANNYYLPEKFEIDLRFCEYSALIRAGRMSREEALRKITEEKPFDKDILAEIKKRLSFSDDEFENVMNQPKKTFLDYPTYKPTFERYRRLFWVMYKLDLAPKSFYVKYTKKHTAEEIQTIRNIGKIPLPWHTKPDVKIDEPISETRISELV